MAKGKAAAKEVEAREKAQQVVDLRRQGATFGVIAKMLGYSGRSGAYDAYKRLMERRESGSVELHRKLATDVLEQLIDANWRRAMKGEKGAADVILRAQDQINRLHGAYAPTKTELTGKDGGPVVTHPHDELLGRLAGLADRLAGPGAEGGGRPKPDGG